MVIEYGAQSIEIRFEDLPSLRTAIDGVLDAFGVKMLTDD